VAAAGLATGLTAGAIAIDLKGEGASHWGAARTAADVSTVAFIVGGAGAAAAGIFWWLEPKQPSETPPTTSAVVGPRGLRVAPWVTPFGGGLAGAF
jgi:hypothetical protein